MTYAENLMRSSVVPHTIARETAQNMNWKIMNAVVEPLISPATMPPSIVPPIEKKKPESPMILPAPPKASAKPIPHQAIDAIEKLARIFAIPVPAFFPRENPISRNAKPACMNITSTVATRIHVRLSSSTTCEMGGSSCAIAAPGSIRSAASPSRDPRASERRKTTTSSVVRERGRVSGAPVPGSLDGCRNIPSAVSPCGRFARKLRRSAFPGERKCGMFSHVDNGLLARRV